MAFKNEEERAAWAAKKDTAIKNTVSRITEAFRTGSAGAAMAQVFLAGSRHADKYSFNNQFIAALMGYSDVATFQQWLGMGRKLKANPDGTYPTAGCYLMRPAKTITKEDTFSGEKIVIPIAYDWFAVFGLEQTEEIDGFQGVRYQDLFDISQKHIDSLPLLQVAKDWGITVTTYKGQEGKALGYMTPQEHGVIALGVANLATWAHELTHHADYRAGNMNKKEGQEPTNEIVAELGGAVLLTIIGQESQADWGGAYRYCLSYADGSEKKLMDMIMHLTKRIEAALTAILEAAQIDLQEAA